MNGIRRQRVFQGWSAAEPDAVVREVRAWIKIDDRAVLHPVPQAYGQALTSA